MPAPSNDPAEWRPDNAELVFMGLALLVAVGYCGVSWAIFGPRLWHAWAGGQSGGVALLLVAVPPIIVVCGGLALTAALRTPYAPHARLERLYTVTSTVFWMLLPPALVLTCGLISILG